MSPCARWYVYFACLRLFCIGSPLASPVLDSNMHVSQFLPIPQYPTSSLQDDHVAGIIRGAGFEPTVQEEIQPKYSVTALIVRLRKRFRVQGMPLFYPTRSPNIFACQFVSSSCFSRSITLLLTFSAPSRPSLPISRCLPASW